MGDTRCSFDQTKSFMEHPGAILSSDDFQRSTFQQPQDFHLKIAENCTNNRGHRLKALVALACTWICLQLYVDTA